MKKKPSKFPNYGCESIYTYVRFRGHVLPVTSFTDQFGVVMPDGSHLWLEPWDVESPFEMNEDIDREEIRERELARVKNGLHRNKASDPFEVELAFRRCEKLFED